MHMEDIIIQSILESMTDSLLVIRPHGEIVYANQATERILGCNLETLRAEGLGATFFTKEANDEFNDLFVNAIQNKSLQSYGEVPYEHPDGSVKRLEVTMSHIVDATKPQGSFVGFMAIFKDVTEVYELRRREKRVEVERRKVLQQKAESLQKLASGVAHEIRNPTVAIGGFAARLLRLKGVPEDGLEYARKIIEGAGRLESLVQNVQSYCDIKALEFIERPVVEVIRKSISDADPLAREKDIEIKFDDKIFDNAVCSLDPAMVNMALFLVLENAIYFSPNGSSVNVGLTVNAEDVMIQVIDSGPGIKPEDKDFIFDPFFSTRADSAGMGLATAQKIAHEHMGSLAVESGPGMGTCASLRLPKSHSL
jgi:PAS domain S-box-containing protein